MKLNIVIGDDVVPICDGCGEPWPKDLPGGYKWDGFDPETNQPLIKLYCTKKCAEDHGGQGK